MPDESFEGIMYSSDYTAAFLAIKNLTEKTSKSAFVYIENEKDRSFWIDFFGEDALKHYEFNMASGPGSDDDGSRGKARFERNFSRASQGVIFAIDADFDPLTPNRNGKCSMVRSSEYIIHTYGYSKESITLSAINIDAALSRFSYYIECSYRVNDFLQKYSRLIYDCLVKFLYLLDRGEAPVDEEEFHRSVIPGDVEAPFFKGDWSGFSGGLDFLSGIFAGRDFEGIEEYRSDISQFGLLEDTAYQFISGHEFENKIIRPIIRLIQADLERKEINRLKGMVTGQQLSDKINEMRKHFNECVPFNALINSLTNWREDGVYMAAKRQVGALMA